MSNEIGAEHALHIAIVGVGGVGSELIQQLIDSTSPYPISIIALSNSRKMLLFTAAPDRCFVRISQAWVSALDGPDAQPASLDDLLAELSRVAQYMPGRVVCVDNSSSETVAEAYPRFLDAGVHVVTPNKKAFSGSLALYERIFGSVADRWTTTGTRRGVVYNEATVGAGLPIISTLKDLVNTGDKVSGIKVPGIRQAPDGVDLQVKKIEGVFSGTLSYIFNEYSRGEQGGPSFSTIVQVAKENGYTVSINV